ncbi:MAG: Flp pilus assembly complex ATPase component TadA [Planctomycetes bacterium]|nr:Flp pilus assembly complex ATPase component TadA [Planctomycetota bacterium]MCB9920074.1 Flp pilus assembly complex ATPase component TadA [Planctomycetota bacterium]
MASFDKKLSSLLVKSGCVTKEQCEEFLAQAHSGGKKLSEVLVEKQAVSKHDLLGVIAAESNTPPVDLEKIKVADEVSQILPEEVATSYGVVPLDKIGDFLTLAVVNPFDVLKLDDIRIITGCELRTVVALESQVETVLAELYKSVEGKVDEILDGFDEGDVELSENKQEAESGDMDLAAVSDGAAPVVKMINKIIFDAVTSKVSDIHVEPFEHKVLVRFRKDGSLIKVFEPPKRLQNSMVSRLKIMSKLDIAEKRKPQDGKFQMKLGKQKIDFRVSTLPVVWGEKVVLRILDSSNLALDIHDLGFETKCMEDYLWACAQPYGKILVTGPTGSGKSTTLYSAIKHISSPEINIVTVEDPVEYTMEGINQVPISNARGLTFAAALRSILRQDPDVILLGEIRDKETIEIATKAALTGHLVLSTLHTNDAPSTITRMIDMGLDPFMVASSVLVIAAQRLAKRVCKNCREPIEIPIERLVELGLPEVDIQAHEGEVTFFKAVGCSKCANGYKGRFALLETLRMTEAIKRLIIAGGSVIELKKYAVEEEGMITLRRAGLRNAMRGVTSVEEVLRCTMAD